jgi:hypothetical protein
MSLKRSLSLAVAGALLAASLSPVVAAEKQHRKHYRPHWHSGLHGPAYRPGPGYAAGPAYPRPYAGVYGQDPYSEAPPGSPACVPMCRWDSNPCDPPYFKMMDGRCNPAEHGGF